VVPIEAAIRCEGAALPTTLAPSKEEYRAFSMLQTGELSICEKRRALAVGAAEDFNAASDQLVKALSPQPWYHWLWPF
jgi:hypothetical protein